MAIFWRFPRLAVSVGDDEIRSRSPHMEDGLDTQKRSQTDSDFEEVLLV